MMEPRQGKMRTQQMGLTLGSHQMASLVCVSCASVVAVAGLIPAQAAGLAEVVAVSLIKTTSPLHLALHIPLLLERQEI